ncbi:carbohydrate kinase family protein [Leucobacter sp. HY1910]
MRATPLVGVAGDLVEDIIVWLSGEIAYGTDTPSQIFRVRGGSAANVAHALAVHGCASRLITRVGRDAAGDGLVRDLTASGVDVRAQRGERSDTIVILIDASGERTMMPDRSTARAVEPFTPAWLDGLDWLHVPLYGFDSPRESAVFERLCAGAKARGIPLSVDASSVGLIEQMGLSRVQDLLGRIAPRVLFANEEEAALLGLPHTAPPRGALWVIKRGGGPVLLRSASAHSTSAHSIEVPVPPVPKIVDTTGAGDHFAAGFLASFARDPDPVAAARAGARAAAQILAQPGAHAATYR